MRITQICLNTLNNIYIYYYLFLFFIFFGKMLKCHESMSQFPKTKHLYSPKTECVFCLWAEMWLVNGKWDMLIQSVGNSVKNGLLWINFQLICVLYYISFANQKNFGTENWHCEVVVILKSLHTGYITRPPHHQQNMRTSDMGHKANICITHSQNKCWSTFIIGSISVFLQK